MKNKPLTISLLVAVVAIWAWIMYSVFDYMESPDVLTTKKKAVVSMVKKDTSVVEYVLALNYKDPFLKKEYYTLRSVQTIHNNASHTPAGGNQSVPKTKKAEPVKEEIPLPPVNYVGRIQNKKLNKPVAILVINEKEYMMQEGETNEGILLKGIMNDSVKVIFSKKTFYVKKQ